LFLQEWDFFRALNKFRSTGISHGVYARSVMGTAASSAVRQSGASINGSIVMGLEFARGTYVSPLGQQQQRKNASTTAAL
jgi:hypothetical protein